MRRCNERFRTEMEVDFSLGRPGLARFRVNAFHQRGAAAIAVRLIPFDVPTFADLDLPPVFERIVALPQGLVLVTGPTGSGKSTTMATMIDRINERRPCTHCHHRGPDEYLHLPQAIRRHPARDRSRRFLVPRARSWPGFREDPDVVLVGEMRRHLWSIVPALTVAETDTWSSAPLHNERCSQSADRRRRVFPAEQQQQIRVQLADSLQVIVPAATDSEDRGRPGRRVRGADRDARGAQHRARGPHESAAKPDRDRHPRRDADPRGIASQRVAAGVVEHNEAVARSMHAGEIDGTTRVMLGETLSATASSRPAPR